MQTVQEMPGQYQARDGTHLPYRYFAAEGSKKVILFLHGITEPSLYLQRFGQYLASGGIASVYLPDLRGYGTNPVRRGDIDYIGQLDDDLEDLVNHVYERYPGAKLILGGHSAGGATAIRQAVRPVAERVHGYLLLSPALSPGSPIDRKGAGVNESKVHVSKIVLLMALNALGIRRWNDALVYRRLTPKERLHGTETTELSYRLAMSRMVGSDYGRYLKKLTQPTLVLVGGEDEVFIPAAYAPLYAQFCKAYVQLLEGHNHDQIVQTDQALHTVEQWLRSLPD